MKIENEMTTGQELTPLKRALRALKVLGAELEAQKRLSREPIAIVGMGCRFPGGVSTPDDFWDILHTGADTVKEIPAERWDAEAYYDPNPDTAGKMITKQAAFIQDADMFDAAFFGISPREALSMDPQQRLLLEVSWEALERAGISPESSSGVRTGVFVGITTNDFSSILLQTKEHGAIDPYSGTGTAFCVAAGRISYVFGLTGPSMSIDTACSSSLVSVHVACQNLRLRNCDVALAGGVNMLLAPEPFIYFSQLGAISSDGRSRTFDASASGYGRGEGCGMIVLKRLSDAISDGSNILAVIKGSAVNHDGRSSGLTVPNGKAQQAVIIGALADAGIDASQVGFIETHGTGTSLGDPIELRALAAALCSDRATDNPLYVGAVKTNIGHLEGAAGIAGLIKTVLVLQKSIIPANLHFKDPTPHFDWDRHPISVPTCSMPWENPFDRYVAGISSFGLSGTNAHIVIERPPAVQRRNPGQSRPLHLLCLSGRDSTALLELSAQSEKLVGRMETEEIADACFTANAGKTHFNHRLAILAQDRDELLQRMRDVAKSTETSNIFAGMAEEDIPPRVAFLFTGQGSQYVGMGRELFETSPTFREAIERCDEILRPQLERPLLSVLYPEVGKEDASGQLMGQTGYAQPALFSLEYGLYLLWKSWGIEPFAVMGHGVGEYVAALAAGVFSLEDALKLVAHRARLMQSLPGGGKMAAVFAGASHVSEAIAPFATAVSVAAQNGPSNTVISGDGEAVDHIVERLAAEGIKAVELAVSHAFHSPLMEPMLGRFEAIASTVSFRPPQCSLISNVTGRMAVGDEAVTATYWRNHARQPVRFAECMASLQDKGCTHYLEVGPNPVLVGMGREYITGGGLSWLASLRRGDADWRQMLESLGRLYASGSRVDWIGFDRAYERRRVVLPTYPFQRKRYWLGGDANASSSGEKLALAIVRKESLPGARIRTALRERVFELRLSETEPTALQDHRIYERIVVPGAFHILWILSATEAAIGPPPFALMDVTFPQMLVFDIGAHRTAQAILKPVGMQETAFEIFSLDAEGSPDHEWVMHASGKIVHGQSGAKRRATQFLDFEEIQSRCQSTAYAASFYPKVQEIGLYLGPSFQCIGDVWGSDGEALSLLKQVEQRSDSPVRLTAGMIDSCFQLIGAALPEGTVKESVYVPIGLDRFQYFGRPDAKLWCHVVIHPGDRLNQEVVAADIEIANEDGELVARIENLAFKRAPRESMLRIETGPKPDWLYQVEWRSETPHHPAAPSHVPSEKPGLWLILADTNGLAESLAERLEAEGQASMLIDPGEDYIFNPRGRSRINPGQRENFTRLIQDVLDRDARTLQGIVHLWAAGLLPENPDVDEFDRAQRLGCGAGLHALQAISVLEPAGSVRLWIVTRGTQSVGTPKRTAGLGQAALWGMGRVIGLEQPDSWGGLVDLDAFTGENEAELLFTAIARPNREKALAVRQGKRLVPRLARCSLPDTHVPLALTAEGSYLITGGFGALGIEIARWMTAKGARHLVLVGRSAPSPEAAGVIAQLEKSGATVVVSRSDVTSEEEMRAVFTALRNTLPPLRGIVHAAGIIDDGLLTQLEWNRFARVLAPKMAGAWNLHRLSAGLPLDFFVLFSSAASVLGNAGQGSYAAANAFLDSLAHYRHSLGLPAISINWGAWGGVGMAARTFGTDLRAFNEKGVDLIGLQDGLYILEKLLSTSFRTADIVPPQITVLPVRWGRFQLAAPDDLIQTLLSDFVAVAGRQDVVDTPAPDRQALFSAEPSHRRPLAIAYLVARISAILMMPSNQMDTNLPLTRLGFDSLMAVQIRNKVNNELGVTIPISQFIDGPSIAQLADRLAAGVQGAGQNSEMLLASENSPALAQQWEEGEI